MLIAFLSSCKKEEETESTPVVDLGPLHEVAFRDYNGSSTVTPMPNGCHHEVWFQNASGENYSIGTYVQGANGSGELIFMVPEIIILEAVKAFVTIESDNDSNPAPSLTVYSGGDFVPNISGNLLYFNNANDFTPLGSGGICFIFEKILSSDNSNSFGIWLTQGQGPWACSTTPAPNGYLKTLSESNGYCYEHWVEYNGQKISLGKFFDANQKDLSANFYPETGGYNFPGEEFYDNLPNWFSLPLTNNPKYFVSVEPYPDYSPEPYLLWSDKQVVGLSSMYGQQVSSSQISVGYSSTGQCEIHAFL